MYLDQFPKAHVALIARYVIPPLLPPSLTPGNRFIAFIAGSFAAVLLLASLVDPDLFLNFEITPHRTVLFYIGVFATILAVSRSMIPDTHNVFDPEILMREVIRHTHYMPAEWKDSLHSVKVHAEFGQLFAMKALIFVQEILSVVLTPLVLWFSLPDCAPAITDFFREFTVHVDGLGYVCSFAVFDFKRHGNVNVRISISCFLYPCTDAYRWHSLERRQSKRTQSSSPRTERWRNPSSRSKPLTPNGTPETLRAHSISPAWRPCIKISSH